MFVIGTAGHIDHGKSALIHKLTGIDPDRLREEKERGMTIDLGFAWLKLPSGNEVGIIDVPGHERFVKNMLAGVGAIDLALLVIAANESVKPQTREHLDILNLLGIQLGIIVITKKDLVDEDILNLVILEVEDLTKGTFLEHAPVIPVSVITGEGLDQLVIKIDELLTSAPKKRDINRPRLLIDRVFTISGAGTVVTGTLIDGSFSISDEVEIPPLKLKARIRGLQSHKTQVDSIGPGNRVAVNLANINPAQLKRGDVITKGSWLRPTTRIDVKIYTLSSLKYPLQHGTTISFFSGSTEDLAKLHLFDRESMNAGDEALAQLTFEHPLSLMKGDRFVIRSSMDTIGGGIIIDSLAKKHRRFRQEIIRRMELKSSDNVEDVIMAFLEDRQFMDYTSLIYECNLEHGEATAIVNELINKGKIMSIGKDDNMILVTSNVWQNMVTKAEQIVKSYHEKYRARTGIPKGELSSKLKLSPNSPFLHKLFSLRILIDGGATVRHPSFHIRFSEDETEKINEFLKQLDRNPYAPEVDIILNSDILNQLIEQQKIIKTGDGVIFSKMAYEDMVAKVIDYIKANGKITLAAARDLFNTSRKYAKALLEYMDDKKITKRIGDERVLR